MNKTTDLLQVRCYNWDELFYSLWAETSIHCYHKSCH